MNNFFEKIFKPGKLHVPSRVLSTFLADHKSAYNCEWSKQNNFFEVIFYHNDQECIAIYTENAKQVGLKRNLKLESAPKMLLQALDQQWELMNLLEITEAEVLHYECIVRDKDLVRYALYINSDGQIVSNERL